MIDDNNKAQENTVPEIAGSKTRRTFITTAAQVAVTAPAVGLLLSASTKSAAAAISQYQATNQHILDDYTFGNNEEDVDALSTGSNFSNFNQKAEADDVYVPPQ